MVNHLRIALDAAKRILCSNRYNRDSQVVGQILDRVHEHTLKAEFPARMWWISSRMSIFVPAAQSADDVELLSPVFETATFAVAIILTISS